MKQIFVVDDEKRIRELIELYLKKEGYQVTSFDGAAGVIESFAEKAPDLLVLDIMMEGMDGLDLCKEIRRISEVPIIFVSARTDELDRILGLELGADDYLAKPFSPRELMVRIKTILKRSAKYQESAVSGKEEVFVSGDFSIIPSRRAAFVADQEVALTIKEYELMEYFLRNLNLPLSREQIIENIWGYHYDGYDRNVDDTVKRLRKKLKDHKSSLEIKTVWGYGYKVEGHA